MKVISIALMVQFQNKSHYNLKDFIKDFLKIYISLIKNIYPFFLMDSKVL